MKRSPLKRKTPLRAKEKGLQRQKKAKAKKPKKGRLRGDALHALYDAARHRDGEQCVNCGAYVPEGSPMHHEMARSQGGRDRLEDVCTLCLYCHATRHHKSGGQEIAQKCLDYLYGLYPDTK